MNIPVILNHIRGKRRKLNYPQEYMAAKLAISQKTYSRLETNVNKLTINRLYAICMLLEIDIYVLLAIAERERSTTSLAELTQTAF